MRRPAVVGLCLGIALLGGLALWLSEERRPEELGFHERSCWFPTSEERPARCGWMVVPENRSRAESRRIALPVVIFRAHGEDSPADALLFINGGPGYRTTIGNRQEIETWWAWVDEIPKRHEVIVLGLRGTGREAPDFNCPKLIDPRVWSEALRRFGSPDPARTAVTEAAADCRDRLIAEGVDLTAYNSLETAADVEDLRLALRVKTWSLYGISYGSRIALTAMRHHPQGLKAVILDSVFPPQAAPTLDYPRFYKAALNRLFADCHKSTACRSNFPRLAERFEELRQKLAQRPRETTLEAIGFWPKLQLRLDDKALLEIVYNALYWWDLTERLPFAISSASTGDFAYLEFLATEYYLRDEPSIFSPPVMLSFLCNEEAPFETAAARAEAIRKGGPFGHMIEKDWVPLLCPVWPAGVADALENTAVESDIPTLLLAGSYDPVTPPELARQAAAGLTHSHMVLIRNVGHAVFDSHACARTVVSIFLADPTRAPDAACLDEVEAPDFSGGRAPGRHWFYLR